MGTRARALLGKPGKEESWKAVGSPGEAALPELVTGGGGRPSIPHSGGVGSGSLTPAHQVREEGRRRPLHRGP